jgi:hypothetical protein
MTNLTEREEKLSSETYKFTFMEYNYYLTISNVEVAGITRPYEMFINSKDNSNFEWLNMLTLLITAVLRTGADTSFLIKELKGIHSAKEGSWVKLFGRRSTFYSSLLNVIGEVLEEHVRGLGIETAKNLS